MLCTKASDPGEFLLLMKREMEEARLKPEERGCKGGRA